MTVRRYARTLDEAFKTPRYAAALELPYPSWWRRLIERVKEILS